MSLADVRNSFRHILILVEGPSEENFVKHTLNPHLARYEIWVTPIIFNTRRTDTGSNYKGGIGNFAQFQRDIRPLLGNPSVAMITTMIDLYGLPTDFPGMREALQMPLYTDRLRHLYLCLKMRFPDERFSPYFSAHEFEALIWKFPQEIEKAVGSFAVEGRYPGALPCSGEH